MRVDGRQQTRFPNSGSRRYRRRHRGDRCSTERWTTRPLAPEQAAFWRRRRRHVVGETPPMWDCGQRALALAGPPHGERARRREHVSSSRTEGFWARRLTAPTREGACDGHQRPARSSRWSIAASLTRLRPVHPSPSTRRRCRMLFSSPGPAAFTIRTREQSTSCARLSCAHRDAAGGSMVAYAK